MSQKVRIGIVALFVATAAVLGVGGAASVRAHEVEPSETEHVNTTTNTTTETETEHGTTTTKTTDRSLSSEAKQRIQGKLDDAKKKVCNVRVTTITRIMTNAAAAGQKHLEVFNKVLARIEEFATNKKLSVPNYTALISAADAKKDAAAAAITAVKNNTNFTCDGDNPIASVDAFNGKVKAMQQALKDYRTAIGTVLKAVKQAAQATEGSTQQ
jgi:hypothetical protein